SCLLVIAQQAAFRRRRDRGLAGLVRPEMTIDVHGELDRAVPGPILDLLRCGSLLDPEGDGDMAQRVEAEAGRHPLALLLSLADARHIGKAGGAHQRCPEAVIEIRVALDRAVTAGEQEAEFAGRHMLQPSSYRCDGGGRKRHRAAAALALDGTELVPA